MISLLPLRDRWWAGLLAAVGICGTLAGAPRSLDAQAIEGVLRDAEAGLPIAGAVIILLDTQNEQRLRVRTDLRGEFRLPVPEAGDYTVWAEREGYASTVSELLSVTLEAVVPLELAISALRTSATVLEGESADDLDPYEAALRYAAMLGRACEGRYDPTKHAILVGIVRDSVSNVNLPGVSAVIEWRGAPDSTARVRVQFDPGTGAPQTYNQIAGVTDDDGAFMICNVPAGVTVALWAEAGEEARAAERAIEVKPGTIRKEDIILGLTNQTEPGDILGRVRGRMNGDPVVGADVRLQGTDFRTITNERGTFTLEQIPWGIYVIEVDHIAYASAQQAFRVQGGRAHQMEVLMTEEAIELDPLTVTVRPRSWFSGMSGLQHRINLGFGYVLEREDLERRGASNIGDALRGIPGVRVQRSGLYGSNVVFRSSRNLLGQSCRPTVWMDGVRITLDPQLGLNEFTALDLEVIEVYRSAAEVPGEFSGDANCGVLVLWTRRGIGR